MYVSRTIRDILGVRWRKDAFISKFSSVQKLIDYLWWRKSGSPRSINTYCWCVSSFCSWAKCNPDVLICKPREELEEMVQNFLDGINRRSRKHGQSARYVNNVRACLITFFRVNGFNTKNNKELRIEGYHQPPRVRNKEPYIPTIEEACRMAERAGNTRNRAIILTLYSTGLRNSALRAIQVGDIIEELEAGVENLLIKVEPEWNQRIPGACKNGIPYYTFTSTQATDAIREMLKRRKEIFGFINKDEPLFISGGSVRNLRKPLSAEELQKIVKNAAKEAGIKNWKLVTPHSLRKVFESTLRSPMIDGDRMDPKDQEFLMGHVLPGSQEAYYDWTKIDQMRRQYAKLCFEPIRSSEIGNFNLAKHVIGFDVESIKAEIERELGRSLTMKEEIELIQQLIKIKFDGDLGKEVIQKVIHKKELQNHLDVGWKFLSAVDENTIIVQKTLDTSAGIDLIISKLFMDKRQPSA